MTWHCHGAVQHFLNRRVNSMEIADVVKRAYAMPLTNPSFPPGPYRFFDREYIMPKASPSTTCTAKTRHSQSCAAAFQRASYLLAPRIQSFDRADRPHEIVEALPRIVIHGRSSRGAASRRCACDDAKDTSLASRVSNKGLTKERQRRRPALPCLERFRRSENVAEDHEQHEGQRDRAGQREHPGQQKVAHGRPLQAGAVGRHRAGDAG